MREREFSGPVAAAERDDFDGGHRANRLWGHLLIGFAVLDAYLIRERLTPELVQMPALLRQIVMLAAAAAAAAAISGLLYLLTARTSRARTRVYLIGAFLFAAISSAMIVSDYRQFARPGTFTERMILFQGRLLELLDTVRGGLVDDQAPDDLAQ